MELPSNFVLTKRNNAWSLTGEDLNFCQEKYSCQRIKSAMGNVHDIYDKDHVKKSISFQTFLELW